MPSISMSDAAVYGSKLGELLEKLADALRDELVHREFCVYWLPNDQLPFIASH